MMASSARDGSARTQRGTPAISSPDDLAGATEKELCELFLRGTAADPAELGELPHGRLLAVAGVGRVTRLARGFVASLALRRWEGVVFDHGGTAGANRFQGREAIRFRCSRGASLLDAGPALILAYDAAPAPFRWLRDEYRRVGVGIALGPTFLSESIVAWSALACSSPR